MYHPLSHRGVSWRLVSGIIASVGSSNGGLPAIGPDTVVPRWRFLMQELTDRELFILRTLQGTATQREIGAALFLSVNTVKAYTKSLYRKLDVASRQDAVAAGRQLGLI